MNINRLKSRKIIITLCVLAIALVSSPFIIRMVVVPHVVNIVAAPKLNKYAQAQLGSVNRMLETEGVRFVSSGATCLKDDAYLYSYSYHYLGETVRCQKYNNSTEFVPNMAFVKQWDQFSLKLKQSLEHDGYSIRSCGTPKVSDCTKLENLIKPVIGLDNDIGLQGRTSNQSVGYERMDKSHKCIINFDFTGSSDSTVKQFSVRERCVSSFDVFGGYADVPLY